MILKILELGLLKMYRIVSGISNTISTSNRMY